MVVHDSKYARVEYDKALGLIKHIWKQPSIDMLEHEFKDEMLRLVSAFDKYKPRLVLVDQREFYFTVLPELQIWVDRHVNKELVVLGVEKVAFIVSPDFLAHMSVTQTLSESHSQNLNAKFFDDPYEANQWLGIGDN